MEHYLAYRRCNINVCTFKIILSKVKTIEDEIQQKKPFTDPYQKALVNLIFTEGWVMNKQKVFFKQFDITPQQYNILRILKGASKPMSTLDIRERLLDQYADTSRLINRMEAKILVSKTTCASDTRKVDIVLSPNGQKLLDEIQKEMTLSNNPLAQLSENEANQLSALLDKIRTH